MLFLYNYAGAKPVHNAYYGQGSGPVHSIFCTSSAQNISQCSINTFFFCTHSDDAGVICAGLFAHNSYLRHRVIKNHKFAVTVIEFNCS